MVTIEQLDEKLETIRKNLYRVFQYEEVEMVMEEVSEAIDDLESVQDMLLELEE